MGDSRCPHPWIGHRTGRLQSPIPSHPNPTIPSLGNCHAIAPWSSTQTITPCVASLGGQPNVSLNLFLAAPVAPQPQTAPQVASPGTGQLATKNSQKPKFGIQGFVLQLPQPSHPLEPNVDQLSPTRVSSACPNNTNLIESQSHLIQEANPASQIDRQKGGGKRKFPISECQFRCKWAGCSRRFRTSSEVYSHMRVHTGERPFKCDHCGKAFAQSGGLIRHVRTHTGDRPYACSVPGCDRRFCEPSNLTRHVRTHTRLSQTRSTST
eukprot:c32574_g1_i1.p1 GENE.c32574_g1_i1~~c32574_g1_i1.p1  ORF type:complete len:266 (+),score=22.03 c32574_g1_i1:509-1306(+)